MAKKVGSIAIFPIILCSVSLRVNKLYEIVFLATNKYGLHFISNKIAKIVNCSHKTATKWLNRWGKVKDLADHPRSREPRTTTIEQD